MCTSLFEGLMLGGGFFSSNDRVLAGCSKTAIKQIHIFIPSAGHEPLWSGNTEVNKNTVTSQDKLWVKMYVNRVRFKTTSKSCSKVTRSQKHGKEAFMWQNAYADMLAKRWQVTWCILYGSRTSSLCKQWTGPWNQDTSLRHAAGLSWVEQCLTSHQTHYRSYRGRVSTGQMTQPTVSKHWGTCRESWSWARFYVPSHIIQVILGTDFYRSNNTTNSIKAQRKIRILRIRLQSHQIHLTVLQ